MMITVLGMQLVHHCDCEESMNINNDSEVMMIHVPYFVHLLMQLLFILVNS